MSQESEQIRVIDGVEKRKETVESHPYWKLVDPSHGDTVCHVLAFSRQCHVPASIMAMSDP
jgi:hypothetical protein